MLADFHYLNQLVYLKVYELRSIIFVISNIHCLPLEPPIFTNKEDIPFD